MKVTFAKAYDHLWPSRAETAYPAGWSGTVKQEVADAAREAGVLEPEGAAPHPARGKVDPAPDSK
jgi:hypothetical protein